MRIKKVRIRNFRSIIDSGEISLDDKITILLGKNEQGKTNVLKAIESFRREYEYEDDDLTYLINPENELQQLPIVTMWFKLDDYDKKILSSIYEEFGKKNELVITKYFDGHYEIEKPDLRKLQSKVTELKNSILKLLEGNKDTIEKSLDLLNKIDKNKHINWLKSLQRPDGGFSHIPGQPSHITHTYFAVKALKELGALGQIDKNKIVQFILSCQHPNGGFGHLPNQQPQAQFTYHAIMLLKEVETFIHEMYDKSIDELNKTSSSTKIWKLLNDIINIQILDDKLIDELKKKRDSLKNISENTFIDNALNAIPNFVYFDSIDLIEDSISIDEYLTNKEKYKTFTHLFRLASLDIDKVKKTTNAHRRKLLFRGASTSITGMINEFWKQEKVTVNLDIDGDQILIFIEDEFGAKADPPSRRSDGFRWFLSFYINFMEGTKGELKNTILLLDNPGWVLHPSGQKDLLEALEKIAETNQIIIATHSPFLIDKNKLERIRIVERGESGTKVFGKFWDSTYDSLQVIRAAIGADVSDSLFGYKNNIIVEGYSDVLYLEAMVNYLKRKGKETLDLSKVMILGAGGADKVPYILAWQKAEKYKVLAVLDADDEGRKAKQEMERRDIGIDVNKDILMLDEISNEFKGKSLEFEDLFTDEFYNVAVNRAYREIFENKLGNPEINLEEIPSDGLKTKRYARFFKDNSLGGFDKVKVAKEVKKILSRKISKEMEEMLEESVDDFEKLFIKIKEKFKDKGAEL